MSEFQTQATINAPADDVFAFVTNVANMPQYMPTLHEASVEGDGHIRMKGEVKGKAYDKTGWYQVHEFNHTMLWGATGANDYSGDLEVVDQHGSCILNIHLKFESLPEVNAEDRKRLEEHGPEIQKGMEEMAAAIKKSCEQAFAAAPKKSAGYVS